MMLIASAIIAIAASATDGPARPNTVIARDSCVTAECHADTRQHTHVHGPVLVNSCDSCHALADAEKHTFSLTRTEQDLCVFCHAINVPSNNSVHEPYAARACLSCHDPHGGKSSALLRGERYDDLCKACHGDITMGRELVHGPASAGACGACHEPHAAPHPRLLAQSGREMCLRCHVTTGIEIDTMHVAHDPARGDCLVCHDPHATDQQAMLTDEPVALCTSCHTDIAEAVNSASTQHAAVTSDRSCLNCHSPHATDYTKLLHDEPMALCFECHDKPIEMPDGRKLQNMKKIIESGKSLHGPVAEHDCTACHEIHGGGHTRLLTAEYPSDLYYPFKDSAYALCFSCHDKQSILVERTDTLTGFRNGDLNLHYVHVNRNDKGRSCSICHDSHAASREHHIRDKTPFGPQGWMLPINFKVEPEGGSCAAGCHRALSYSRTNPVVYPTDDTSDDWRGGNLVPGSRAEPQPPDTKDSKDTKKKR